MARRLQPEQRRTIVVLEADERRSILRDPDRVELIDDPETKVVSFPPTEDESEVAAMLRGLDLLRPGTLAIQSPYDPDRYVGADAAMAEFTVEKFLILTQLAKLLGAKRVTFEDVRADHGKSITSGEGTVKTVATTVESKVSRALENDLRQRLKGEHVFPGSTPDIQAARSLLAEKRLTGDPQLVALVDLRDGKNPLMNQEIHFSGTRESAGNLSAALRIAGGPGRLKLAGFSSDVAREWDSRIQIEVRTRIEF